jgi:nicotinamidase-related amidase
MNVMVVDMIEGFARQGALSSPRVAALIPKQVHFLEQVPSDTLVVFLADVHEDSDHELEKLPKHCMAGTKESEVCPELLKVCKDRELDYIIIPKQTWSGFFDPPLKDGLDDLSSDKDWVVMGCVTDICVSANVFELLYRGKDVTVLRDCVDTYDMPGHDAELINKTFFDNVFPSLGARVVDSDDYYPDNHA